MIRTTKHKPSLRVSSPDILVVEGPNDSKAVHAALACETIETNGMAVEGRLPDIRDARAEARVFVFTDSDSAGLRIRGIIHDRISGCSDVFLPVPGGRRRACVEKAAPDQILAAVRAAGVRLTWHLPVLNNDPFDGACLPKPPHAA